MPSENLTSEEIETVKKCLMAILDEKLIDDSEFETVMGATRKETEKVALDYPDVDEYDDDPTGCDDSRIVINNTFANLIGYPGIEEGFLWSKIKKTKEELQTLFDKWKS